jgi:methylmalonyl-CoA carboxyltransferase 1.3S subunit
VKLTITIEKKTYEVEVEASEPEQPQLPPAGYLVQPGAVRVPASAHAAVAAAPRPGDENVDEDKVCRSPISGIVVKVPVQEGQSIQAGDTLLVLEAMKMETNITAPGPGRITKIRVNPTDSVQGGQILVEFE